jgi:hypothetical protein
MAERARQGEGAGGGYGPYAPGDNPADPNEHRHGDVVHSHTHSGPHEHGDDYEYDEAHDPEQEDRQRGRGEVF